MTEPRPRAYSYVRMSTPEQLKGDSRRRQLEAGLAYALEHDLELIEERTLEDIGVSAYSGANASTGKLAFFLEAVRSGSVPRGSYLLVESLDRLSREHVTKAFALFTELTAAGINLVTLAVARQPSCPGPTTTLAGFEAAGVGVLFGVLVQVCPSFWLSLMVVAGISS